MTKNLKRLLYLVLSLFALYYSVGAFFYSVSQRSFCAQVNRFVVTDRGDEIISLIVDGQARGYRFDNVFYPPFVMSFGSQKRKERLIVGQYYNFKSAGFRVFNHKPVIIKDEARKDNQCL